MKKFINLFTFCVYSLLCFGVAGYAFYYLSSPLDPSNSFQSKMLESPLVVPLHFYASGVALSLIPFQWSKKLRRESLSIHRWLGYLYVTSVALGGVAGLIMSFNATGGIIAKSGFFCLSVLWLWCTFMATKHALNKNIAQHRVWIYRSIAFTSAAITLRLFLGIGLGVLQYPFLTVYVPTSWLCWVINIIICEIILFKSRRSYRVDALA